MEGFKPIARKNHCIGMEVSFGTTPKETCFFTPDEIAFSHLPDYIIGYSYRWCILLHYFIKNLITKYAKSQTSYAMLSANGSVAHARLLPAFGAIKQSFHC
jgi:hypothetical protein